MPAPAIVSIVIATVLLGAVAGYLVKVVLVLRAVNDSLGKVTFGVRAIAHRTAPVGPVVTAINSDLVAVGDALEATLALATQRAASQAPAA